jgi:hypothetical protein
VTTPTAPRPHPLDQPLPLDLPPANPTTGEARLADALARVAAHADPEWWEVAVTAVYSLASRHRALTTDQVWQLLDPGEVTTHERRALGAVMRATARAGLIAPTDRYVPSERPQAHRRPVRVWRSLLREVVRRG